MSGGSQHNPNGRQSQLGSGWSPLQLLGKTRLMDYGKYFSKPKSIQMGVAKKDSKFSITFCLIFTQKAQKLQVANLLARAPQAHMASDRGVTWHTPTPPPHLYHVPAPSPPDPLQALKSAGGNSVFRHTATPPELYRHTPTPPDKHHMRHTPSPGDIKASAALPPVDLYQHLGPSRADKLRADDLMAYTRVGVDLSLGGGRAANGAATSPAPPAHAPPAHSAPPPALSVRDAPTINSLIARAQPRHPHARVDALLERLVPSPVSPHSVIVHSRAAPTPSPPSSNEDSADSCGAPPGSKRKRKPERTVRVAAAPPPLGPPALAPAPPAPAPSLPPVAPRVSPPPSPPPAPAPPLENGDAPHVKADTPDERPASPPRPEQPHARRKTRSGSAETIDDIAAMIADTDRAPPPPLAPPPASPAAVTVDKLRSVLASPDAVRAEPVPDVEPAPAEPAAPPPAAAAAPRRRSARTSNPEAPNVPVESPSEAKPAEPEASDARTAEPAAASFVEVENQLEKMFAGLEEEPAASPAPAPDAAAASADEAAAPAAARKRRRSAPARSDRSRDDARKKAQRKKTDARRPRKGPREPRDAYDSGSNASSSKSRGPYIQIRGPRDSPLSVSVMNNSTGEEEDSLRAHARRKGGEEFRNGVRGVRGVRGLHASTLGLRYDATTPDATWLCAFCQRGPHAAALGDLFGPYALDTDCDEYRSLDEATRRRYCTGENGAADEVWFHEACAVWAPGLVACGARVWGLRGAVWGARAGRCAACAGAGAALACAARACRARAHLPCARAPPSWSLQEDEFRALCPRHA